LAEGRRFFFLTIFNGVSMDGSSPAESAGFLRDFLPLPPFI
jgi:hypothetical protein